MKTLNEQIQRLRDILVTCYKAIADKGGTIPEVADRNMTNLPAAVQSVPQVVGAELEELTITENGTYTPSEGVDGFSQVVANVVPTEKVKVSTFRVNNACINADGRWEGESLIDTSECTSLWNAFYGVDNVIELDLKSFNTSNIVSMEQTFRACRNLKNLDVSNWDTSKVTTFFYMFTSCVSLRELDLTNWDVGRASQSNSFNYFLNSAVNLTTLIGGRNIDDVLQNNISCLKNLKKAISLDTSYSLDRASLRAVINGLADLTGSTAQTLTLGTTLLAKLTEEDIAVATNKNWTIA